MPEEELDEESCVEDIMEIYDCSRKRAIELCELWHGTRQKAIDGEAADENPEDQKSV